MAHQFTDQNFKAEVLQHKGLALVDFYTDWCGPCRMMAPVIEELAKQYAGKAKIGKLDVYANSNTAGQFGISSIPTLIFFKDGKQVGQLVGFQSKESLEKKIKEHS